MKLLIVDDEPKIRNGLTKLLSSREGWQVTGVFEDAPSALNYLYQETADVIITDIRMPELSGLDLIRQIRERDQEIRIIILSGYSNFSYAQKAIELGVYRYLLKPTDPKELIAVLNALEDEIKSHFPAIDNNHEKAQQEVGNLLVAKAIQYVQIHYSGKITLQKISAELHLSPNYLCELFKRHTGKNLMEYVTEYRMEKAGQYLNEVKYNVSDVARMVGYKEAKYFSSAFKKAYGKTPLEYRNKQP